jgi:hypothetical protein
MTRYPLSQFKFLYIIKSPRTGKKYAAVLEDKTTKRHYKSHFGDPKYQQYKDTTGLGLYSHLDHKDKKRQQAFLSRHAKNIGLGSPPAWSPGYFSGRYLWSGKSRRKSRKA